MTDDGRLAVLTDEELAKVPFDELVVALQQAVQRLEGGSTGLEESIELYRHGLRLHAACETRLRQAELTITELGRRGARSDDSERPTEDATERSDGIHRRAQGSG